MPDILAKTWTRFVTTNFCVTAEIMGSIHEFDFDNHHVSVKLTWPEQAGRDAGYDNVATVALSRASNEEVLSYRVRKVDVEIAVREPISVPEEALSKPPKQVEHFSEEQQQVADRICDRHSELADRAFQYWLEMIRWASGAALIGQPSISGFESGWSTYLMESSTNHRVWASTVLLGVYRETEVTKEHWGIAAEHLRNGDDLPMHLRFLHDAGSSARHGQYKKAIIEIAMACEIYIRYAVFEFIPVSTPAELVRYIEEANINKYASHFFKSLVDESQISDYKNILKEISSLMSRRNSYVHMGQMDQADDALCQRFIYVAKKLFEIQLSNNKNEN
jgi:hypothetical protein